MAERLDVEGSFARYKAVLARRRIASHVQYWTGLEWTVVLVIVGWRTGRCWPAAGKEDQWILDGGVWASPEDGPLAPSRMPLLARVIVGDVAGACEVACEGRDAVEVCYCTVVAWPGD